MNASKSVKGDGFAGVHADEGILANFWTRHMKGSGRATGSRML